MTSLKFEKCGEEPRTREPLYRLIIGGRTVREDLTLDQVVEAINRRDEERLGWEHAPREVDDGTDCHANASALARNDGRGKPLPYEKNGGAEDGHGDV